MEHIHAIWIRESERFITTCDRTNATRAAAVNTLQTQPHVALVQFLRAQSTDVDPSTSEAQPVNPSIWQTLELLAAARDRIGSDTEERRRLSMMWQQLHCAYQFYHKLMMKHCFSTVFARKEQMFPGWTQRYLRAVTFQKALEDTPFAEHVQRPLDPRLYVIRATARLLRGMNTLPLTRGEVKLIQDETDTQIEEQQQQHPTAASESLQTAAEQCEQSLSQIQTVRARCKEISTVWNAHSTVLQSLCANKAYEVLSDQTSMQFKDAEEEFQRLCKSLSTAAIRTIEPETPLIQQAWEQSTLMLDEWIGFLSFAPSSSEISGRITTQRTTISSAISGIFESTSLGASATNELWLQRWVKAQLQPAAVKVTSRAHAPITMQTLRQSAHRLTELLQTSQAALAGMGISIEYVQKAAVQLEQVELPKLSEELDDDKVHAAWRKALHDAVVLDSCSYMLKTLDHLRDLKHDKASAFIQQQLSKGALADGLCSNSRAVQNVVSETSAKASEHLRSFFHAPFVQPTQALIKQLQSFRKTIDEETHSREVALRRAAIQSTQAALERCQVKLQQLSDSITLSDSNGEVTKQLAAIWARINNASQDSRYSVSSDILFELRNALQTRQQLEQDPASLTCLRKFGTLVCVTFAAQSLADSLTATL